ncbi:hypothetical protein FUAX_21220 [Fulvitalea axinellae]|uniref:Major royal jelly protein n=1 Tax=Fulvitalea axinellae TaxID=1182444 RepID=A0AAU9DBF5_9BACT|nr:hypothetical protein FUAX_21220 [Fulvitalea axinellae]
MIRTEMKYTASEGQKGTTSSKLFSHVRRLAIIAGILATTLACNDPEDALVENYKPPSGNYTNGVFVLNEGNFDWGVGTLSFFSPEKSPWIDGHRETESKIFRQINDSELGNVSQSMTIYKGKGYIVINNSERVIVTDPGTIKWTGTIEVPGGSPRYLLPINTKKAYLTELYVDCVWIVDLENEKISGKIPVSGWTEGLILFENYALVTKKRTTKDKREGGEVLLKIDTRTDEVVDSVALPKGPSSIVMDQRRKAWVLCDGGLQDQPNLVRLNPFTMKVEKTFPFPNEAVIAPGNLRSNETADTLYFLNGGVCRHPIDAPELNPNAYIPQREKFYAMDIEPGTGLIYVGDALDYLRRGIAYRFRPNGHPVDSFRVGVIPTGFTFNQP